MEYTIYFYFSDTKRFTYQLSKKKKLYLKLALIIHFKMDIQIKIRLTDYLCY